MSSQSVSPKPSLLRWLIAAIAVVGFLCDYFTKEWALASLLPLPQPPSYLGGWLSFPVVFNPGAAFSMGSQATIVFTALALSAVLFLVGYVMWRVRTYLAAVVVGCLIAGVSGNLADRLFRPPGAFHGHVVDFIAVQHFAVFNVADIFISAAAVLMLLLAWFYSKSESDSPLETDGVVSS